eukprot:264115_1
MRSCFSPRLHISSITTPSPLLSPLFCTGLTSLLWCFRFRLSPVTFWLPQHRPTASFFLQFHVKLGDSPFGFDPPKEKLTHSVMGKVNAYFYSDATVTFILLSVGPEAGDRAVTNQATRAAILGVSNSTDYALLWGNH